VPAKECTLTAALLDGAVMKTRLVRHFRKLEAYQNAIALSMRIFTLTKDFPGEENIH
jgi:hypothetical protein